MAPKRKSPSGAPCGERLLDAALAIVARDGWRGLGMSALARETDVPMAEIYRLGVSKPGLLKDFIRRIDLAALAEADAGAGDAEAESPRDRLFDAVMLRFEALEPYRDAVRVLARELPRDPLSAMAVLPRIRRSLRWTLESADLDADGLAGAARIRLLGLICWRSLGVWLDDTEDLARTMADLDRRLRRAGRWLAPSRSRPGTHARPRARDKEGMRDDMPEGSAKAAG